MNACRIFFLASIIGLGRPSITGSLITMATPGDDVTLECEVDAHPIPKLSFSRDSSATDKITNSSKYEVRILRENRVRLTQRTIGELLYHCKPYN